MPSQENNHGDKTAGRPANARRHPLMPLVPMPEAPANDNELELIWIVREFFGRHLSWLVPTTLLAALSLGLLFLRT